MDFQLLKQEQITKAAQIICQDDDSTERLQFIGGADVGFEQNGDITRAVLVVLTFPELVLVEYQIARIPTQLPYIPGFLSFRECPALLAAWEKLSQKPSLLLVDGQGVAHPRGLGVASHLGLSIDCPTIGVAKKRLVGEYAPLTEEAGATSMLMDKSGQQIGTVLRSKTRCNPLFISTGHRISQQTALLRVQQCLKGYRLPEPIRWADAIASRKPAFLRWQKTQHH